jgi:hypothetical protein
VGNSATLDILIPANTIDTGNVLVNERIVFADDSIRIGDDTGASGQQVDSIAIGQQAGQTNQGTETVAIGLSAG